MSRLGLGVMIKMLGGDQLSLDAIAFGYMKVIKLAYLKDNNLYIRFEDNTRIYIYDDGQSCCENRYMSTDDDLPYFSGAKFLGIDIKNGPDIEDGSDAHEVQFLEVTTSKGVFTMANHNEHNGYYGGFSVEVRILK